MIWSLDVLAKYSCDGKSINYREIETSRLQQNNFEKFNVAIDFSLHLFVVSEVSS